MLSSERKLKKKAKTGSLKTWTHSVFKNHDNIYFFFQTAFRPYVFDFLQAVHTLPFNVRCVFYSHGTPKHVSFNLEQLYKLWNQKTKQGTRS